MLFDLEREEGRNALAASYDVAIVGAGPAGITVARKLAEEGRMVLLLEGGGKEFSQESQDIYRGQNIGLEYFDLDVTRLRFLGGSSNHWEGLCRELDDIDFLGIDEENEAWPISKSDLSPYRDEVFEILDLRQVGLHDRPVDDLGDFSEVEFYFSQPTHFGEKYLRELEESENIKLVLNASVTSLRADTATGEITQLEVKSTKSGNSYAVNAKIYVLALGGIENPRLLLNSNMDISAGIGNAKDLVGRYFMEHPMLFLGDYIATGKNDWGEGIRYVSTTEKFINRTRGLNSCFWLTDYKDYPKKQLKRLICGSDFLFDIAELIRGRAVSCGNENNISEVGQLIMVNEQSPIPYSRVKLSSQKDAFGANRIEVDWKIANSDLEHIKNCVFSFATQVAQFDLARLRIEPWLENLANLPLSDLGEVVTGGHHHMGTTRMGSSAMDAVVNGNCRCFNHDNLYIAGSSVFMTSGHANPTYTIIQLSLRLAKHLNQKITGGS